LKKGYWKNFKELISDFKEANRKFNFNFLHKKGAKYCETHQRSYKKYWHEKKIHLVALSLSSCISGKWGALEMVVQRAKFDGIM
jgi:hypothetical protein